MTNIQTVESNARKVDARRILKAELPECLRATKSAFDAQKPFWDAGMKSVLAWGKQGGSKGIILQGGVGRGKSELMGLMLFCLADLFGKTALYLNEREVSLELRESYKNTEDARSEWKILELARQRDCIAWDDAGGSGNENAAPHVKELLRGLIDIGSANSKLFIMAANLDDAGLAQLLQDEREASRRAPWERIVVAKSVPDFRKGRK
jgi:DNA replication protein DnaC